MTTPFDVPSSVFASYILNAIKSSASSPEDYREKIRMGNEFLNSRHQVCYQKTIFDNHPFDTDFLQLPHHLLDDLIKECYEGYPEVYDQFVEDFYNDVDRYNEWSSNVTS